MGDRPVISIPMECTLSDILFCLEVNTVFLAFLPEFSLYLSCHNCNFNHFAKVCFNDHVYMLSFHVVDAVSGLNLIMYVSQQVSHMNEGGG